MWLGWINGNDAIARVGVSMRKWVGTKCEAHRSHSFSLLPHYGAAFPRCLREIPLIKRRVEFAKCLVPVSGEDKESGGIVIEVIEIQRLVCGLPTKTWWGISSVVRRARGVAAVV